MPKLSMSVQHQLGQEEALRRMKDKADAVWNENRDKIAEGSQTWNDNQLSFSVSVMGMKIPGQVVVGQADIVLSADVPFIALAFKGMIEDRVRQELGTLLA